MNGSDLELLAPAGDWDCLRAAVAHGADAVYFGLPRFNARMRATNFAGDELGAVMEFLHARGRRGLVAFNTLVFTGELPEAERQLRHLADSGVDAIIVQDVGLARLAQEVAPELALHASTQMTLTSPEGIRFALGLGMKRAVLARELSLRELAKFDPDALPLEVFVHGALCVAYSGQCLTSEALGQRSANRGECAQACRLPYQLVVDGAVKELGDKRYLLSPQDLAAVDEIPALVKLGIRSFKIEGRLKSPEYVAAVTRVYRRALDAAVEGHARAATSADRYALEMVFSRGLFSGWLHGVNHQELVHARYGKKRGAYLGRVVATVRDGVELDGTGAAVAPGDGIVFDTGGDTEHEQGGRVFEVSGHVVRLGRGKLDGRRIPPGTRVWKTDDPHLNKELRATLQRDTPALTDRIDVRADGQVGELLRIEAWTSWGRVMVRSLMPLQEARTAPLQPERFAESWGRLGGTTFHLGDIAWGVAGAAMVPVSELNRMRREAVAALDLQRPQPQPPSRRQAPGLPLSEHLAQVRRLPAREGDARWAVLCRNETQIEAVLETGLREVYLDFEDIRRFRDAVARVREASSQTRVYVATPRIQKAGESGFFRVIEQANPDGILIRNVGGLEHFRGSPWTKVGDFSLNVANPLSAAHLMSAGLDRVTVSYDLNAEQVLALLEGCPRGWFEISIHQHMPMFHMEHCVFAAFLSTGTDHTNCGRPCERHDVTLRDRVGMEHPLKADVGCRNTVFHGRAQSGVRHVRRFAAAGAGVFRIELLNETGPETRALIEKYLAVWEGACSPGELLESFKAADQLGVTEGTLTVLS